MSKEKLLQDLNKIDCCFLKFVDSSNTILNMVQFDCVLVINPFAETSIFTFKDAYFEHVESVFKKYGLTPSFNNTRSCFWAFYK